MVFTASRGCEHQEEGDHSARHRAPFVGWPLASASVDQRYSIAITR
jgi:hypothetical protein